MTVYLNVAMMDCRVPDIIMPCNSGNLRFAVVLQESGGGVKREDRAFDTSFSMPKIKTMFNLKCISKSVYIHHFILPCNTNIHISNKTIACRM